MVTFIRLLFIFRCHLVVRYVTLDGLPWHPLVTHTTFLRVRLSVRLLSAVMPFQVNLERAILSRSILTVCTLEWFLSCKNQNVIKSGNFVLIYICWKPGLLNLLIFVLLWFANLQTAIFLYYVNLLFQQHYHMYSHAVICIPHVYITAICIQL